MRKVLFLVLIVSLQPAWGRDVEKKPQFLSVGPLEAVEQANDRDYLPVVQRLVRNAQKTIDISLDGLSLDGTQQDPVLKLLHDMMDAARKGVKVRIFLNTQSPDEKAPFFLQDDMLNSLRHDGVELHYVNPKFALRDRLLIADGEWVLEGGLRWEKEDLQQGLGSATLSRSEELADKKRVRLELLPLWDVEVKKREKTEGGVGVPVFLLRDKKYFAGMVRLDDSDAMKIYLALLRGFYASGAIRGTWMFEDLAAEIPADEHYERYAVGLQVLKSIERLEKSYGLVAVERKEADRVTLTLILPSDLKPAAYVPLMIFHENYAKQLSARALMAYFIILLRSQAAGDSPVWLGSERNVEQDFPVTREDFRLGVEELQRKNLIEVFPFMLEGAYSRLEGVEYRYQVNPVLSLSEKIQTWTRLRDQFGDSKFDRARELAEALGENEDPKVMAVYMELMERFPLEDIRSFTEHISGLEQRSTPQKMAYLKELLEHETRRFELATTAVFLFSRSRVRSGVRRFRGNRAAEHPYRRPRHARLQTGG